MDGLRALGLHAIANAFPDVLNMEEQYSSTACAVIIIHHGARDYSGVPQGSTVGPCEISVNVDVERAGAPPG